MLVIGAVGYLLVLSSFVRHISHQPLIPETNTKLFCQTLKWGVLPQKASSYFYGDPRAFFQKMRGNKLLV